jgi:hypothetical protein
MVGQSITGQSDDRSMPTNREHGDSLVKTALNLRKQADAAATAARRDELISEATLNAVLELHFEVRHGNEAGPSPQLMGALDELTTAINRGQ